MTGPSPHFTFCPHCANRLELQEIAGRRRAACPVCRFIQYRNPAVGVAAVVRDVQGRVLLVRRKAGRWSFPSGYVEWDEHVREVREVREELGIAGEVGAIVAVHSNFHNRASQTVGIWFAVRIPDAPIRIDETELTACDYFDPADPPELAYPTDVLVMEQLRQG